MGLIIPGTVKYPPFCPLASGDTRSVGQASINQRLKNSQVSKPWPLTPQSRPHQLSKTNDRSSLPDRTAKDRFAPTMETMWEPIIGVFSFGRGITPLMAPNHSCVI